MGRKEFLKICGFSCLGVLGLSGIMQSCGTTHYATTNIQDNRLVVSKKEFEIIESNPIRYRNYIVSKVEGINYPIIIYKNLDETYSALLLRCSHQGAELNVNGDVLTCSAHGSEFGKNGEVIQGPAEQQLTAFKVQTDAQNIYIQLS
ncbi:Cytochrome b6-f complex iron-sulfur subunit [compost metagenome]